MVLSVEDHVEACLLVVLEGEAEGALSKYGHKVGCHERENLDGQAIALHGGVDEHDQRGGQKGLVLLVFAEVLVILEQVHCHLVNFLTRQIKANQTFFGVHFAVELKHFVSVVFVDNQRCC